MGITDNREALNKYLVFTGRGRATYNHSHKRSLEVVKQFKKLVDPIISECVKQSYFEIAKDLLDLRNHADHKRDATIESWIGTLTLKHTPESLALSLNAYIFKRKVFVNYFTIGNMRIWANTTDPRAERYYKPKEKYEEIAILFEIKPKL